MDSHSIRLEFDAIGAAPIAHSVALLITIAVVWFVFRWTYGKRIGDKDSTIQNLQSTLGLLAQQLATVKETTAKAVGQNEEQSRLIRVGAPTEQLAMNSASSITTVHELASAVAEAGRIISISYREPFRMSPTGGDQSQGPLTLRHPPPPSSKGD